MQDNVTSEGEVVLHEVPSVCMVDAVGVKNKT